MTAVKPLFTFNFSVKNQGSGTYDVNIDGDIVDAPTQEILKNWFGDETSVSFKSFRNEIERANPKVLNVYVNSGGGAVSDAMAMHDYLVDLESKGVTVNRIGRGIIASAATYIMMGANSSMSENSMMMIHNIQMVAYGDINDVENQVKGGRKFNDLVQSFYVNETGKPKETVSAWMNKETWFTAQEAKDNGFVKNISGKANFSNSIKPEKWPFSNTAVLNLYNSFTNNSKNSDMNIENITAAVKNALQQSGIIKNSFKADEAAITNMANTIAKAIEKEVSATITDKVKTAVANELKDGVKIGVNVDEAIKNALKTELARTDKGSIAEAIANAVAAGITDELKENATIKKLQGDMTALENNVAKKLGNKAGEKPDEEETEKDKKENAKRSFYNVGKFIKAPVEN